MATIAEPEAPRMTLADFSGPGAPPDDFVQQPSKGGEGTPAPAVTDPAKGKVTEPPIAPLVDDTDDAPASGAQPDPDKPAKPDPDEPEKTLADSMDDPAEVAKREAVEKAAAEKKAEADAAAAAEKAKGGAPAKPDETRDDDLKVEHGAHTHPKTRKVITEFQAKAKAARDERDAAIAKAAELEKRATEAEAKAKAAPLPKETEEEIKTLRERVRELDISKDPILEAKYDKRIAANNQAIVDTLKAQGYGMVKGEDGKMTENPKAIAELVKSGLTLRNLSPLIKKLEEAELVDEADAIREAVRANNRLTAEKTQEIESWKGDYTKRQAERESLTKQQREAQAQSFRTQTDTALKRDMETLEKDFAFIKQPPSPFPTDTPATVKAKEAALAEWNTARTAIENAVKAFSTDGVAPEKLPEIVGNINASAIQAIVLKNHVLPRVLKDIAALTVRNKELEAELGKIRDAGKLSRDQISSAGDTGYTGRPEPKSLDEAFTAPGT